MARKRKTTTKRTATKRTARTKRRPKRRDEEPEVEEEEEDQEGDEEEDQEESREHDQEDVEEDDDDVDEVVTGKMVSGLAASSFGFPAPGEWALVFKKHEIVKPDKEADRPGGFRLIFDITDGPTDEPDDGWGEHTEFLATRWWHGKKPAKNEKQRVNIGTQMLSRFVTAVLGTLDPDEEMLWSELLRECRNAEVIAVAEKDKNGYINTRSWRMVE